MLKLIKNEFIKEYTAKRVILTLFIFTIISLCIYLYNIVIPKISSDFFDYREEYYSSALNMYEDSKREYEEQPNPKNLFRLKIMENIFEQAKYIKDNNISYDDWRYDAISSIESIEITILKMLLDGYELSSFYTGGEKYLSLSKEKIKQEYEMLEQRNKTIKDIVESGYYYDYAKIVLEEEKKKLEEEENKEIVNESEILYLKQEIMTYEFIIDKKIESKDNFILKEMEYLGTLNHLNEFKVLQVSEFYKDLNLVRSYANYEEYIEISSNKKLYLDNEIKKTEYAISNDIKYNSNDYKKDLKTIIYMFFVIGIFIIARSGSSISEEQNNGSLRLLLTQGVSRGKVLLSKFISIIIDLYIHYFIFAIIFVLIGLLFYPFKDLITPNIDVVSGNIVLNNYFLYFIKMMFLSSIPIIFFAVLSLFMSVVTLNTVLSIGLNVFIMIIGLLLLNLIKQFHLDSLQYTPLPYFDLTKFLYISNSMVYESLAFLTSTYYLEKGIIVLIIWTIIIYLVTHFVFTKRDVVNQ